VRELALASLERDLQHLTRATPGYSDISLCLETLGRLPSEVYPKLTCREHTVLTAYHIIGAAYRDLAEHHHRSSRPSGPRPA
jgi:hypothetical protein